MFKTLQRSVYDLVILKEKEMSGGNERKKVERLGGKEKVNEDQFSIIIVSTSTKCHAGPSIV